MDDTVWLQTVHCSFVSLVKVWHLFNNCICDFNYYTESLEDLQAVVQERLAELLQVLKAVIGKHQTLNSVDILGAAGTVIAKVKGQ